MFFLLHLRSIWRCFYTFSSNVLHFTPSSSVYKSTLHPNLLLRESFTHVGICSILFLITLGPLLPSFEPHISSSHFQQAIILHPLSYHTIPAFLCNASSVPSFKVSVITPCLHLPLLHQEQECVTSTKAILLKNGSSQKTGGRSKWVLVSQRLCVLLGEHKILYAQLKN